MQRSINKLNISIGSVLKLKRLFKMTLTILIQILEYVIREMAQWLGTFEGLVSNTHTRRLINTYNSISLGQTPSFAFQKYLHSCAGTLIQTHK